VISVDAIEAAILRSGISHSFETGLAAYNVGATIAESQLAVGLTVVADAANYLEVGRTIWRTAAQRADAAWRAVHVVCSDEAEHRQRLGDRQRRLDPFPEPTWAKVQQWRGETEPWTDECLVLDTVHPIDDNVDRLLQYIDA
jgi:predicted kinase